MRDQTSKPIALAKTASQAGPQPDYDAIVIGAGVCGIYQLHRLQEMGLRATVLEAGGDVGGTWYWNRYPGARFDSESYTYGYSFSKELLAEWNWSERFAAQPETERYLRHVVDKFDLRRHMQFNCLVRSARYEDTTRRWSVTLADGRTLSTRFLLTAIGLLSTPTMPRYAGVADFKGPSFHTYHWPKQPIDFAGKRVAVIGTGATGVQVISAIADKVGHLTVFQRRPNWCAPLHNAPISAAEMAQLKASYESIFATCRTTHGGFIHVSDSRRTLSVAADERNALWEKLYAAPGFGIWLGNFDDTMWDEKANAELTAFVANKIRQRVRDPDTAEQLIPKDHGFGTRRVPLETRYYETFNRENVELVDLKATPIERITATGIRTSERDYPFDIIIYATGFDAITGAFDRIEFTGRDGQRLRDKWTDGPLTAFGIMTRGFPNLFTLGGPQSASITANFPRGIEEAVDWCSALLKYLTAHGHTRIEPKQGTEDAWAAHVQQMADLVLLTKQKSWFTGYNGNVERAARTRSLVYVGGAPRYRQQLARQAETGYEGFDLA